MFHTINKCLVRATTVTLAVLALKISMIYLVPMAVLFNTHGKELTRW
ncbi:hypothetical protein [Veronia pacifica]|nr:hypothetical protein [Veronia pacifica]